MQNCFGAKKLSNSTHKVNQREKFIRINNMNLHLIISWFLKKCSHSFGGRKRHRRENEWGRRKITTCCYDRMHTAHDRFKCFTLRRNQNVNRWRYARRLKCKQKYSISFFLLITFESMHSKSHTFRKQTALHSSLLCIMDRPMWIWLCLCSLHAKKVNY